MNKPLFGVKTAILIANGFCQDDMVAAQKALLQAGANVRIVSPENGLVNGWDGEGWGHHFAVDVPLGTALGADYALLVVPGGQRSIEKLNLTAHTKRFIGSFMSAGKPVAVMGDGLHALILTDTLKGRAVSGPEGMRDLVSQAGGEWQEGGFYVDGALITGATDKDSRGAFVARMLESFTQSPAASKAA